MAMASFTMPTQPSVHARWNHVMTLHASPVTLFFPLLRITSTVGHRVFAVKTGSDGSDLLNTPVVSQAKDLDGISEEEEGNEGKGNYEEAEEEREFVDWENQILDDTVPLVGFVRMILHSGKYERGDKLNPEHESIIVERLLPYHPACEKKIGCGIDYLTIGYHPDFPTSRCLFIVRKDGTTVDFSYWKCIKGLIRKNYPLYADSFILRHFKRPLRGSSGRWKR